MTADWRSQARALALQCLTQLDVQGDDLLSDIPAFIADSGASSKIKTLASELAHGAWHSLKACDELIASTVKHWQLQRIALIDRSVLRLAVGELLNRPDVPVKVVLDQAIELSKRFSTAESPQFINGVLDAIVKRLAAESRPAQPAAQTSADEIDDKEDRP